MEQDDPIAKYSQIAHEIVEEIEAGKIKPGERVPSENEIRARYDVSNTTARKALQQLEMRGYVSRIKGRGSFVRDFRVGRAANKILSFTKNMLQAGYEPRTQVLYAGLINTDYTAHVYGRRYTMKGPMYKIHRLRFADATPVLLEVRFVSQRLCPDIDRKNLAGSLYNIYQTEYGLELTEVQQSLSAMILDDSSMQFFNIQETTPGILLESVTFTGKETILEMERSIYRGDFYRFYVSASVRDR